MSDKDLQPYWHLDAECAKPEYDPDMWFPAQDSIKVRAVKEICATKCQFEHQQLCLRQALENGEQYGIWGGYTYRERRIIARNWNRGSRTLPHPTVSDNVNDTRHIGTQGDSVGGKVWDAG